MRAFRWAALVILFVLIDQFTKYLTEAMLPLQEPVPLIPFLSLFRTYNYGVAFSMLSSFNGWPLNLLTIGIILFILWLWRGLEEGRWLSSLGYALVIGGAIGNLVDRVRLGKVVDMILFQTESWSFAVFNVADSFITVGAAAIILDEFLKWRAETNQAVNDKGKDQNE